MCFLTDDKPQERPSLWSTVVGHQIPFEFLMQVQSSFKDTGTERAGTGHISTETPYSYQTEICSPPPTPFQSLQWQFLPAEDLAHRAQTLMM